jgi:hypothetical protein
MTRVDPSQHELGLHPEMQPLSASSIARIPSMTQALVLCQTLSGKEDKAFLGANGVVKDQAQWSRIMGASPHNFPHDKLNRFMDLAGNEAPLMWLLHSRGYDIERLSHVETKLERHNRLLREENAALRRVLAGGTP